MKSTMDEETREDEIVAKSGDSGRFGKLEDSDPWSSGEIKQFKAKWLQEELAEERRKSTEATVHTPRSSSLSRRSSRPAVFLRSRSYHPSHVCSMDDDDIGIEAALSKTQQPVLAKQSVSVLKANSNVSPSFLEYLEILIYLALFGIIGVLIRYGLEVLFQSTLNVTHEATIVYRDLPANIVGSFFMGWVGVVFKELIRSFSEPLAVGLSTGLMGSITTYAGWNQKMVVLLTTGDLAAALAGLLLGMAAAIAALHAGIDSARALQFIIAKARAKRSLPSHDIPNKGSPGSSYLGLLGSMPIAFAAACLWAAALCLLIKGHSSQGLRILWFACLVGPPGVWMRWHLARLNGRGIRGRWKWLPIGTLSANLIGAALLGVFALLQFKEKSDAAVVVLGGLQLGFIGCLTTVSTFVAEVYTMQVGRMPSKAYLYMFITLTLGLVICVFVYSIPAWKLGYSKW